MLIAIHGSPPAGRGMVRLLCEACADLQLQPCCIAYCASQGTLACAVAASISPRWCWNEQGRAPEALHHSASACCVSWLPRTSCLIPTTWTEESERSSEMWLLSFLGVRKHLRQLLNIKSKCVVRLCLPGFSPATGLWNVSSCRCVGCYLCMVCGRRLSCRTNINNMLWGNFPWELVGRNLGRFLCYQNYRTLP